MKRAMEEHAAAERRGQERSRRSRRLKVWKSGARRPSVLPVLLIAALFLGVFGCGRIRALADEIPSAGKYYTSILLQPGDTLWTAAARYNCHPQKSDAEYVRELRFMNGLTDDTVHAGHYLTVSYYRETAD